MLREWQFADLGIMRIVAGCCAMAGVFLAGCGFVILRARLYDSLGKYKGFDNIGTGPLCLIGPSVCLFALAWATWRSRQNFPTHSPLCCSSFATNPVHPV